MWAWSKAWGGGKDVIEHQGGKASLARETQEALKARLKGPIWPDKKQGAWPGPEPGFAAEAGTARELRRGGGV